MKSRLRPQRPHRPHRFSHRPRKNLKRAAPLFGSFDSIIALILLGWLAHSLFHTGEPTA